MAPILTQRRMRITYIISDLSNSAGMERVVSQKASWLATNTDNEITVITLSQKPEVKDYFTLSERIKRVKWYLSFQKKSNELFRLLNNWLEENPQTICISTYGEEFNILHRIKDGSKKVVEFHFAYDINKHWMSKWSSPLKANIIGGLKTWLMARTAKKYDKIVCLTKADFKRWNNDKVVQIYNPLTITPDKTSDCTSKTIVAMGRLESLKGFDMLIYCWKLVEQKYPDWQLKIYGGGDASIFDKQISELGVNHVSFPGRTSDVPKALCSSSIYVSSSRSEGFGLTILEAMTCGLPIVTFDCPSGPAELVSDGVNGYVVDRVGDIKTMAKCLLKLIENEQLRKEFGQKSFRMSEKYKIDSIMKQWVHLFEELAH